MSIPYGTNPYNAPLTGGYGPTYKVRFEWISEAWTVFSREAGIWIGSVLIYAIAITALIIGIDALFGGVLMASNGGSSITQTNAPPNAAIMIDVLLESIVILLIEAYAVASLSRLALKQLRGERVLFGDAFGGGPTFGNALIALLLGSLLCFAGFLGLCIGAFAAIGFMMPLLAITSDGERVLSAFGKSFDGMKRDWLTATGFVFVWYLIYGLSAMCYIGVLATVPMTIILGVIAYRDMVGMPGALPPNAMGYFPGVPSYGQPQPGQWPPPPTQAPFGQAPGPYGQPYGNPQGTPPPYGQPGQMPQADWQQPGQAPPPPYGTPPGAPYGQPPQQGAPQPPWQPPQQGPGQPPQEPL